MSSVRGVTWPWNGIVWPAELLKKAQSIGNSNVAEILGGRLSRSFCDLSLTLAGLAFCWIDFAARLNRLHHQRKSCPVAFRANMLLDLWLHI